MNCFSLKAKNAMISRTSKLLEIYGLDGLEPQQFPKMSYHDNPEVVSSNSFQIYVAIQPGKDKSKTEGLNPDADTGSQNMANEVIQNFKFKI